MEVIIVVKFNHKIMKHKVNRMKHKSLLMVSLLTVILVSVTINATAKPNEAPIIPDEDPIDERDGTISGDVIMNMTDPYTQWVNETLIIVIIGEDEDYLYNDTFINQYEFHMTFDINTTYVVIAYIQGTWNETIIGGSSISPQTQPSYYFGPQWYLWITSDDLTAMFAIYQAGIIASEWAMVVLVFFILIGVAAILGSAAQFQKNASRNKTYNLRVQ
jgi:hypothetical protein